VKRKTKKTKDQKVRIQNRPRQKTRVRVVLTSLSSLTVPKMPVMNLAILRNPEVNPTRMSPNLRVRVVLTTLNRAILALRALKTAKKTRSSLLAPAAQIRKKRARKTNLKARPVQVATKRSRNPMNPSLAVPVAPPMKKMKVTRTAMSRKSLPVVRLVMMIGITKSGMPRTRTMILGALVKRVMTRRSPTNQTSLREPMNQLGPTVKKTQTGTMMVKAKTTVISMMTLCPSWKPRKAMMTPMS
jgi:hypothetical protein